VIDGIKDRSKELNLLAGKIDISRQKLFKSIIPEALRQNIEISTEGGLWTILRK